MAGNYNFSFSKGIRFFLAGGFYLVCLALMAQSREELLAKYELWSHYPLINSVKDVKRINGDVELLNIPYAGENGIHSDGVDSSGARVRIASVSLPQLNLNDFVISVEFKLDTPAANDFSFHRTILNAGQNTRWLYVTYKVDSLNVILGLKNGQNTIILDKIKAGIWYTLTIFYNRTEPAGGIYINDSLFFRVRFDLTELTDKVISTNCRCGIPPLQGYWRNLKIYHPKTSTGIIAPKKISENWNIYPQPLPAYVHRLYFDRVEFPVYEIKLIDATGKIWYQQRSPYGKFLQHIDLPELSSGIYFIQLYSAQGMSTRQMIKQ